MEMATTNKKRAIPKVSALAPHQFFIVNFDQTNLAEGTSMSTISQ